MPSAAAAAAGAGAGAAGTGATAGAAGVGGLAASFGVLRQLAGGACSAYQVGRRVVVAETGEGCM